MGREDRGSSVCEGVQTSNLISSLFFAILSNTYHCILTIIGNLDQKVLFLVFLQILSKNPFFLLSLNLIYFHILWYFHHAGSYFPPIFKDLYL